MTSDSGSIVAGFSTSEPSGFGFDASPLILTDRVVEGLLKSQTIASKYAGTSQGEVVVPTAQLVEATRIMSVPDRAALQRVGLRLVACKGVES